MGKLFRIEAGKQEGVELTAFPLTAYRHGGRRIVGMQVEDAMLVRRPVAPPDLGTIDGEALAEAGRRYSLSKVLELPNLPRRARALIDRELRRRKDDAEPDGRICSEVAARILRLPATVVSPDQLAGSDQHRDLPEALMEIDPAWIEGNSGTANKHVGALIDAIQPGLELRAMAGLEAIVAEIRRGSTTEQKAIDDLKTKLDAEIYRSMELFRAIRMAEPTILHTNDDRIE